MAIFSFARSHEAVGDFFGRRYEAIPNGSPAVACSDPSRLCEFVLVDDGALLGRAKMLGSCACLRPAPQLPPGGVRFEAVPSLVSEICGLSESRQGAGAMGERPGDAIASEGRRQDRSGHLDHRAAGLHAGFRLTIVLNRIEKISHGTPSP